MRLYFTATLLLLNLTLNSQNVFSKDWNFFTEEKVESIVVSKGLDFFSIDNFNFEIDWIDKLTYSENIGYYGGIKEMRIYVDNQLITRVVKIEDVVALGEIYMQFYDYNLDGYIDFSYPISQGKSQWNAYYLYNPKANDFHRNKDWDYIRIQKINKKTKQIQTELDGTAFKGTQELYQIKENELIKIKTINY